MVEYQLGKHFIDVETHPDVMQFLSAKEFWNEFITDAAILKWRRSNIENYVSLGNYNEWSLLWLVIITKLSGSYKLNKEFHSF